jgi:hypothetical protein
MNVLGLEFDDPTPQRALLTARTDIAAAVDVLLSGARTIVRCEERDLAPFDLAAHERVDHLQRLLLARRDARVRLLVDDTTWLEKSAARLRLLQRQFSHALELRLASTDDPVGEDAHLLVDNGAALTLAPTARGIGEAWLHNAPHAQPLIAAFDRRWEAAAHNLPVTPLGL